MLAIIALIFAISSALVGFYYFIQNNKLNRHIAKSAQNFAAQTKELTQYKTACVALEQVQHNRRHEQQKAITVLAEANHQTSVVENTLLERQTYFNKKIADIEAQRDHILKLFETIEDERSLTVMRLVEQNSLHQQNDDEAKSALANLKTDNQKLLKQLGEQTQELKQLKARPTINLHTVDTLRRRSTHNETLFTSMRGLREMSDERSQNWEIALKKMATWILTSSSVAQPNDPILAQSIGPIVGEALARIGSSLLEFSAEDELAAEKQALRSSEH